MGGGEEWTATVGAGGVFLLLIVIVWQIAATRRARMLGTRADEYRQMALRYQALLEDNVEIQRRTAEELAQARLALSAVEKRMREIE